MGSAKGIEEVIMDEKKFSLIEECTNSYRINDLNENEVEIRIRIPKKFRSLWMFKLSDLYTSLQEIEELKDEENLE